jgi:TRAP-type C4-dicarboxylate transport system permease small subunit
VVFDILFNALPASLRRAISAILRVFGAAVLVALVVPGVRFMTKTYIIRSASLRIPWSFLVLVYLVGILLMAGHLIAGAVREWRPADAAEA